MQIEVDAKRDAPPSEQIAEQVRFAIAAGELRAGDRLPSVRTLAVDALVNPNTIGKAWRDLEREGVLDSRPGDGVFVARAAPRICVTARDELLRARVERLVSEFRAAGLEREVFEGWLAQAFASMRKLARVGGQR